MSHDAGMASNTEGIWKSRIQPAARSERPHSESDLGAFRELWWHADQLRLLGDRLGLDTIESFADLGCGAGYWTSIILSLLTKPRKAVAIDLEALWLEGAETRLKADLLRRGQHESLLQLVMVKADIHSLPMENACVDLATCQSVLMHSREPRRVLSEMVRILRPGGHVVCVEPDRLINYFTMDSLTSHWSPEEHGEVCRFWHHCRFGRIAMGDGDLAIGSLLSQFFVEQGLNDVRVYQRDKAFPILPPYKSDENQKWLGELFNSDGTQNLLDPVRLSDWARAGGASQAFAERQISRLLCWLEGMRSDVAARRYFSSGGGLMYMVTGRKADD